MDYAIEGAYRTGKYSGLVTTIAAGTATAGHLWACRWSTPAATLLTDKRRIAIIQRLRVRAKTVAGFTAAQEFQLALYKLTGYTVAHTGGNAITPDKKRTDIPAPLMTARIANTAELTAGTHTIATDSFASDSFAELAAGATVPKGGVDLFMSTEDVVQVPWTLSDAEGILLRNEVLMGAAGTVRICVEMDWLELQRYPVGTFSVAKGIV